MSPTAVIFLVLLVSIAASMAIAAVLVRRSRAQADAALAPLGPPSRTTAATALGRTDLADGPLQGTGTLVLTPDELGFAQWRPLAVMRIRRSDIAAVDTTREHLGKTMKSDVLRVTWRAEGVDEQVAFFVRDLDAWLADLGGRRSADG